MAHIEIVGTGLCPVYIILERADDETVVQGVFTAEAEAIKCCKDILQAFIDNKWDYPPAMTIEEWDLNHGIHCELAMFHVYQSKIVENFYGSMTKENKE
jgi:hypothetical protein